MKNICYNLLLKKTELCIILPKRLENKKNYLYRLLYCGTMIGAFLIDFYFHKKAFFISFFIIFQKEGGFLCLIIHPLPPSSLSIGTIKFYSFHSHVFSIDLSNKYWSKKKNKFSFNEILAL
jgi:hypothetical protein